MLKKLSIFMLSVLCFSFSASAEEAVLSFDTILNVQKDGSVNVTETLKVRHEGKQIKRGLVRDLPTDAGEIYQLNGVKRNGRPEPSFVEHFNGIYRINTGSNVLLPAPSESIFEISYTVKNIARSYDGHDEIYWNVTGNDWKLPIYGASARIILPSGANVLKQTSYVGKYGSKENGRELLKGVVAAGRRLNIGEGFTAVFGITPHVINTQKQAAPRNQPTYAQNAQQATGKSLSFWEYVIGIFILLFGLTKKGRGRGSGFGRGGFSGGGFGGGGGGGR